MHDRRPSHACQPYFLRAGDFRHTDHRPIRPRIAGDHSREIGDVVGILNTRFKPVLPICTHHHSGLVVKHLISRLKFNDSRKIARDIQAEKMPVITVKAIEGALPKSVSFPVCECQFAVGQGPFRRLVKPLGIAQHGGQISHLTLTFHPAGLVIVQQILPNGHGPQRRANQRGLSVDTGLSDRTILVTGASGGIGAATVRLLVQEGANVIASGRNVGKLADLAKETGCDTAPLRSNFGRRG